MIIVAAKTQLVRSSDQLNQRRFGSIGVEMTRAKYKRLFIVLLSPLLLVGAFAAFQTNRDNDNLNFRCSPGLDGSESCRSTGWKAFDEKVAKDHPAWFDVNVRPYERNSFPHVYISASQRIVHDVQIQTVSPYLGTPDSPGSSLNKLRSLSGQKISIVFGVLNDDERLLNPLGCNEFNFVEDDPNTFGAGLCGIPNGLAKLTFTVGPEQRQQLMALKREIDEETTNGRQTMIMNYAIITPMFVVFFLIISAFGWIVRRAWNYVAAA